jgi:glycosyltransferase involved in cell wall biosynthesis
MAEELNGTMLAPNTPEQIPVTATDSSTLIDVEKREVGHGLDSLRIPTDDPAAALQLCRSLVHFFETQTPSLSIPHLHDTLSAPVAVPLAREAVCPSLSVVVPIYNEEENLALLSSRLTRVLEATQLAYEVILVDDGSKDKSLEILRQIAARDSHVVVVELARNFGHQVAISAGLDQARGNAVVIMDADLQDPPELLPDLLAKWRDGYQVVYAVRSQRKENWLKRTAYATFYRLLQRVANIDIPLDTGDFCLMDRKVVDVLVAMPERNRFIRGIRSWVGLNQIGIPYERAAREAGQPKYTFTRLLLLALDGFVSFSHAPLRVASLVGIGISVFSFFMAIVYSVQRMTLGLNPPGFATLVVAVFFLAGIQLITIGVMGEYIGRIFDEVKQRPRYVVRQITRAKD